MKNHDNEATVYLAGISPSLLRGTPRFLCFSVASRWSARFRCAVISNRELCEELGIGERQLGRICQALSLKGIMDYTPGRGQGNHSQFRFPTLEKNAAESSHKGDENPTQTRHKPDILDDAIRKENLNLIQNQNLTTPNPAFQAGDSTFKLRHRDHTRIARWIERAGQPNPEGVTKIDGWDWKTVLRGACLDLLIPFDDAVHDLPIMDEVWAARLELKKEPQKVTA